MTDLTVDEANAAPVEPVMVDAVPMRRDTIRQMGAILPAIVAAMGDIQPVVKAAENREQGYTFASIDDFLAMINPICAKHGLIPMIEEDRVELVAKKGRYGDQDWLRFTYTITLWHVSGQHTQPTQRQVEVLRSGAQAFGSAQSYVLKQYLRGLFLIATGEKDDPDFGGAQDEGRAEDRRPRRSGGGAPRRDMEQRRESEGADGRGRPDDLSPDEVAAIAARIEATQSGKDLRALIAALGKANGHPEVAAVRVERLRTLVKGAPSLVALEAFERNFGPDWGAVKEDAAYRASELKAEAEEQARQQREAEARAATTDKAQVGVNTDLAGDEIPY